MLSLLLYVSSEHKICYCCFCFLSSEHGICCNCFYLYQVSIEYVVIAFIFIR